MAKYGDCSKCQTKYVEGTYYKGQWLGYACLCYQEELEKDDGKAERDLAHLDDYRKLVAGTKNIPASSI